MFTLEVITAGLALAAAISTWLRWRYKFEYSVMNSTRRGAVVQWEAHIAPRRKTATCRRIYVSAIVIRADDQAKSERTATLR